MRMCLRRMCNSFSFSFHAINYLGFPSVYYFYRSHLKATEEAFIYLSSVSPYPHTQPPTPSPSPFPTENRVGSAETKHELLHNQRKTFSLLAASTLGGCWRSCSKFVAAILTFIRDSRRLSRRNPE